MNQPESPSPLRRCISASDLEQSISESDLMLPPPQEGRHMQAKRTHTSLIEDMINNEQPSARVKLVFNQ